MKNLGLGSGNKKKMSIKTEGGFELVTTNGFLERRAWRGRGERDREREQTVLHPKHTLKRDLKTFLVLSPLYRDRRDRRNGMLTDD